MKKVMNMVAVCLAVAALCGTAFADPGVKSVSVVTAADTLVFTNNVGLSPLTSFVDVEKIVFVNNSTETGVVVTAVSDWGAYTSLGTTTLTPGEVEVVYPLRSYTSQSLSKVIETNDVLVTVTDTATSYQFYKANQLRLITTLNATNAAVSSIDAYIFTR